MIKIIKKIISVKKSIDTLCDSNTSGRMYLATELRESENELDTLLKKTHRVLEGNVVSADNITLIRSKFGWELKEISPSEINK